MSTSLLKIVVGLASSALLMVAIAGCSSETANAAEVCSSAQACVCLKDCNKPCLSGSCNFTCKTGATCDFQCKGGNCQVACEGTANCNVSCEGGGCNVTGSSGKVKLTACTKDCSVVCDASNTSCTSSCTDTAAGCRNPNDTGGAGTPTGVPTGLPSGLAPGFGAEG